MNDARRLLPRLLPSLAVEKAQDFSAQIALPGGAVFFPGHAHPDRNRCVLRHGAGLGQVNLIRISGVRVPPARHGDVQR